MGQRGKVWLHKWLPVFSDNHCESVRTAEGRSARNERVEPENTDSRNPCQRKTLDKGCGCLSAIDKAERQGFEPWVPLRALRFSSRVLLTSIAVYLECCAVATPHLHQKDGVRCQSQSFPSPAYRTVFLCRGTKGPDNGTRSSIGSSSTSDPTPARRWKSTFARRTI